MTGSKRCAPAAIGPLVLGPFSEMYGRSRVLQLANMWYLGVFIPQYDDSNDS